MNVATGKAGECIAEIFLKQRGFKVWRPDQFVKLLELTAAASRVEGKCVAEPKTPLRMSVPTPSGHVSVTYWRGRCIELEDAVDATPLETSLYLPCVKKCVEKALEETPELAKIADTLMEYRHVLRTVDLFAYKDGVFYSVEVKTNSGKLSNAQREKTVVLRQLRHLVVYVYLQNPLVEIKTL